MTRLKLAAYLALVGLGVSIGLTGGWLLWRPKEAPPLKAMPEIRQVDKSLVLKTEPTAKPRAAHAVPKGAKVERTITATIRPTLTGAPETPGSGDVQVDLSLVRMPDDTTRVIVSSPSGEVVGGIDVPRQVGPPTPKKLRYAVGAGYLRSPWTASKAVIIERDFGFLRLGGYVGVTKINLPGAHQKKLREIGVIALVRF